MSGETFRSVLESWVGKQVTVVNPESFKKTALGQGLSFQTYPAEITTIGEDFIKLSFSAVDGSLSEGRLWNSLHPCS